MAQFSRPTADVSNTGGWTQYGPGSSNFDRLDETSPNGATDGMTHVNGTTSPFRVSGPALTNPATTSNQVIRVQARRSAGTNGSVDVVLRNNGNTIATLSTGTLTGSFAVYSLTLSAGQSGSINWAFGYEWEVIHQAGGFSNTVEVSQVEFEAPNAPQTVSDIGSPSAVATVSNPAVTVQYTQTVSDLGSPSAVATVSNPAVSLSYNQTVSNLGSPAAVATAGGVGQLRYKPAALVLRDPGANLNITIRAESVHRVTRAARTWWWSVLGKKTNDVDDPPSVVMPPWVRQVGGTTLGLAEDVLFAGNASESSADVVLRNEKGELDQLSDYLFAGRAIAAYIGGYDEPHRGYAPLWAATCAAEPRVNSPEVIFSVGGPAPRLERQVVLPRFVGIPVGLRVLTTGFVLTTAAHADFDIDAFTLAARIKAPSAPATQGNIFRHPATVGAHFYFSIQGASLGNLTAGSFVGATPDGLTSPASVCDNVLHKLVYGRDRDRFHYLAIDDKVVASGTPIGLCNVNAGNIMIGLEGMNPAGSPIVFDMRIYPYKDSTEMASLMAQRAEGNDDDLVANWRGDDQLGSTITDYANGHHFTATGVLNTDWKYIQTNEGEPELAGQPKPAAFGWVKQAECLLIDEGPAMAGAKPRYWVGQPLFGSPANEWRNISSRGVALVNQTDWKSVKADETLDTSISENHTGVIEVSTAQSDPLTFDAAQMIAVAGPMSPPTLAAHVIAAAGGATMDPSFTSLPAVVAPFDGGMMISEGSSYADLVGRCITPSGLHRATRRNGAIGMGMLLPTVSPGPFGRPCLEWWRGNANSQVRFPADTGAPNGSHTVCAWMQLYGYEASLDFLSEPTPGGTPLFDKRSVDNGQGALLQVLAGRGFEFYHPELTPTAFIAPFDGTTLFGRHFVMATWDEATKVRAIYVGRQGGVLTKIGQQTGVLGAVTDDLVTNPVLIGGRDIGMIGHVAVFAQPLSVGDGQDVMDMGAVVATSANGLSLSFSAALDEGDPAELLYEYATDTFGTMVEPEGMRWAPKAVFDLRRLVRPTIATRAMNPAWAVRIDGAQRWRPLQEPEISSAITSKAERWALRRQSESASTRLPDILADYPGARSIEQPSFLRDRPMRAMRNMLFRFGAGREVLELADAGRRGLLLNLTDEFQVLATRHGLAAGKSYRLIGLSPRYDEVTADLTGWR